MKIRTEEEQEIFDELAGKYEYDAEMSRPVAEALAMRDMKRIVHKKYGTQKDFNYGEKK